MRLRKPVSIGVHLQSGANEVPGTQHLDRGRRMCAFSLMGTHRSLRACARGERIRTARRLSFM